MSVIPYITLLELNQRVKRAVGALQSQYGEVRVLAEISSLNRSGTGHIYFELAEKGPSGVVATLGAVIWSARRGIVAEFERETGVTFGAGINVVLCGSIEFHERYGMKFHVNDIDPTYTLGELARKRKETLDRLGREGLLDTNKQLRMPATPQRIAIVSSESAAGYGDLMTHLGAPGSRVVVYTRLFAAIMQGDAAEASISDAIQLAGRHAHLFDVLILTRGGGAQLDLSCFDTYGVGAAVARCPLPVITGIGHERDESVADMVAHTRAKTPTAAAGVILELLVRALDDVLDTAQALGELVADQVADRQARTAALAATLGAQARRIGQEARMDIVDIAGRFERTAQARIRQLLERPDRARYALMHHPAVLLATRAAGLEDAARQMRRLTVARLVEAGSALEGSARTLNILDPVQVLRRGFSITRLDGKALARAGNVPLGSVVETILADGSLESMVIGTEGN